MFLFLQKLFYQLYDQHNQQYDQGKNCQQNQYNDYGILVGIFYQIQKRVSFLHGLGTQRLGVDSRHIGGFVPARLLGGGSITSKGGPGLPVRAVLGEGWGLFLFYWGAGGATGVGGNDSF